MADAVLSIGIHTHRVFVAKKIPLVVIDKAGTRISKAWQVRVRKCAILQTSKDQHDTQIMTFSFYTKTSVLNEPFAFGNEIGVFWGAIFVFRTLDTQSLETRLGLAYQSGQ